MPARHLRTISWLLVVLSAMPAVTALAESGSANFRLIGAAPASTASVATSPAHRILIVGGAGQAVGISASPNTSVVSGGTSLQLPTDRLFDDGLE